MLDVTLGMVGNFTTSALSQFTLRYKSYVIPGETLIPAFHPDIGYSSYPVNTQVNPMV